jgi:hypothetical protein
MEEAVFMRNGLFGLAILAALRYIPGFLDRMTTWAVKHAENEHRVEDRLQATLADELKGNRLEREAARQERLVMHALIAELKALREDIRNLNILIHDFDTRLGLYFNSKGEKP